MIYLRCNGKCPSKEFCAYREWAPYGGEEDVLGTFEFTAREPSTKSRPDLFPPKALLLAGDVLAFGETKHSDQKWKQMSVGDHLGAAYRHVLRWQTGEKLDNESGLSHLSHAMVRLAMAAELEAKS